MKQRKATTSARTKAKPAAKKRVPVKSRKDGPPAPVAAARVPAGGPEKMKRREYEERLEKMHVELSVELTTGERVDVRCDGPRGVSERRQA